MISTVLFRLFNPHPRRIESTLGILDLSDGTASENIVADREALEGLFDEVRISTDQVPNCAVLFVYGSVESDGRISGSRLGLREIIRDSGASVVVVATPNTVESYVEASKQADYGMANLVMTVDRRGDAFATFFKNLFSDMKSGTSMPVAWVKLAPQIRGVKPKPPHPKTVCRMEVGHVALS